MYTENDFEVQDAVIIDHSTGLMWKKSGLPNEMVYKDAKEYITQLNNQDFAGYHDWRLPTIPELMSLLEPEQSNNLYINSIFDNAQSYCWSADKIEKYDEEWWGTWAVDFNQGDVGASYILSYEGYVRAVRSLQ